MARFGPANANGEVADRVRERRAGALTPLDDVLLHSEPLAEGWNALLGAVRTGFELPADLRELVVLRVAAINGADYEWVAHAPLARAAGLGEAHLAALLDGGDTSVLTDLQRACLDYTDAMTRDIAVPQSTFERVREHLGTRQTVELTATVGAYNLVSRFLVAMQIEPTSGG